jgi:hypothetical protein
VYGVYTFWCYNNISEHHKKKKVYFFFFKNKSILIIKTEKENIIKKKNQSGFVFLVLVFMYSGIKKFAEVVGLVGKPVLRIDSLHSEIFAV